MFDVLPRVRYLAETATGPFVARVWGSLPNMLRRRLMWLLASKYTIGVSAVLLNKDGQILLVRHRFRCDSGWEIPGGYVQRGESLDDALRRELREETGYEVEVLAFAGASVGERLHVDIAFLARVVSGTLSIARSEILEAEFFPYASARGMLRPDQVRGIDLALSRL